MVTPRVSIVIPAYNALPFLPHTVASSLAQTWADFELLIIDDGSSDGTASWVAGQLDPRIRLIKQPNQGAATARNTGIFAARGEYIAFLDADDLWEPTKLEQQVACLEASPEVGLVHTAIRYINEEGSEIGRVLRSSGNGNVWEQVVLHMLIRCGSTPLIRRECFDEVGVFDPKLDFAEDWDMWIRIAARYHFTVINQPLVAYRQHKTNMTKNYELITPNLEKIIERAFQNAPSENAALEKEAYGRAYLFAAWRAFSAQDFSTATSLQQRALSAWPKLRFAKTNLKLTFKLVTAQVL